MGARGWLGPVDGAPAICRVLLKAKVAQQRLLRKRRIEVKLRALERVSP